MFNNSIFKTGLLYIKVYQNKILIKNIYNQKTIIVEDCIFSTDKDLIAEVTKAINALKAKRKEILGDKLINYIFSPIVAIQPMELTNKPLSETESVNLKILARGAELSMRTIVWTDKELSDEEVIAQAKKFTTKSFWSNLKSSFPLK